MSASPQGAPVLDDTVREPVTPQKDVPVRLLVCGDVAGQFDALARNIENVEKKQGPFSFVICVGNFLGDGCAQTTLSLDTDENTSGFLSGRRAFPLPVYFIDSSLSTLGMELRRDFVDGFRFSSTLEFLGGFGFRQMSGLNIGFVSGIYGVPYFFTGFEDEEDVDVVDEYPTAIVPENASTKGHQSPISRQKYFTGPSCAYYCRPVLQNLKASGEKYRGSTDLFISCTWPTALDENLSQEQVQDLNEVLRRGRQETDAGPQTETSPALSELIEYFEPRFHVASGSHIFYQRPPFRSSFHGILESTMHFYLSPGLTSKFIGLGSFTSAAKLMTDRRLRFLHALVLMPILSFGTSRAALLAVPSSSTASPFFSMYNPKAATPVEASDRGTKRGRDAEFMSPSSSGLDYTPNNVSSRGPEDSQKKHRASSNGMPDSVPLPPPTDSSSVFVSNMPFDISEESLLEIMASFGEIISANVPKSSEGRSTGKAWITYQNVTDAKTAVAASEQLQSGGRLLRIQHSTIRRSDSQWEDRRMSIKSRSMRQPRSQQVHIDLNPHSDCWFCLGNPNSEKGLVVAVGNKVYVALAKGGMVHQHVLVIPVTHLPNSLYCTPAVISEMEAFINALRACYKSQGLETVVYERFFPMRVTTGMHMQLQIIPIPAKCAPRCVEVFERKAERCSCTLTPLGSDERLANIQRLLKDKMSQPYFYIEMPTEGEKIDRRLFACPTSDNLPFNFGREAVAELMNVPERASWKACVEPPQVESQLALQMQKLFAPFIPK